MGRSLRGAGAPLPAPPLPQRNKTAAIFRFVSNSLRPWGGESRERGVCEGSNERQQQCGALQAAGPHLRQGRSQPRMFLRQREARDNGNNARLPGACLWGSTPLLVRGGPMGHSAWAWGRSFPGCLTGPVSLRRLPGTRDSCA